MAADNWRTRLVRFIATVLGVDRAPSRPIFDPAPGLVPGPAPADAPVEPNSWMMLDSAQPYLRFTVGLWVGYRSSDTPAAQAFQIAQAAINRRAEQVSSQLSILQSDRLAGELAVALYDRQFTGTGGVSAWARCLEVRTDDADREALERYESAQRRLQVLRWQRDVAEHQLSAHQPLLTDPLRATAWWLVGHAEKTEQLPDVADRFCRVRDLLAPSAGAYVEDVPEPDTLGRVVDEFATAADLPAQSMLTDHLAKLFREHGHASLADRIRAVHDATPQPPMAG